LGPEVVLALVRDANENETLRASYYLLEIIILSRRRAKNFYFFVKKKTPSSASISVYFLCNFLTGQHWVKSD